MTEVAPSEGAMRLMEDWLAQLDGVRGLSPRTLTAYRRDVAGYLGFLALHEGGPMGEAALGRVATGDPGYALLNRLVLLVDCLNH
jgi:integrase/recombinase XerC